MSLSLAAVSHTGELRVQGTCCGQGMQESSSQTPLPLGSGCGLSLQSSLPCKMWGVGARQRPSALL